MNKLSSKFVDDLAIKKLRDEKLSKVQHSPTDSLFLPEKEFLKKHNNEYIFLNKNIIEKNSTLNYVKLASLEKNNHYPENNDIYLYYHLSDEPIGNVLFIHGLYDENINNYLYFIKILNKFNLNVYFMTLPYHYKRKPCCSHFSGEYFLSADIFRSQSAFKQSIFDLDISLEYIKQENSLPNLIVGYSMGGGIALRYYILKNNEITTFLINPVTDIIKIIWDNPLLKHIGDTLKKSGISIDIYEKFFRGFDPFENFNSNLNIDNLAIAYANYDQIIDYSKYRFFIEKMGIKKNFAYNAGHVNIFRVPKLANDIFNFFVNTKLKLMNN